MINNLCPLRPRSDENPFQQLSSENKHLLRFMSSKPRPNDEILPFCVAGTAAEEVSCKLPIEGHKRTKESKRLTTAFWVGGDLVLWLSSH